MRHQFDQVDRQIMQILQKNARTSLKDIAAQIFLSSPATSARIEKLEREGYILGYHTVVNSAKLGNRIKAFVSVEVLPEKREEFLAFARECLNIIECSCMRRENQMLLEVMYANLRDLEDFVAKVKTYGRTQSQIVYSTAIEHREVSTLLCEPA